MIDFWRKLFSTDFMPHGYCLRLPEVIWLHEVSDLTIAISYFLIPLALLSLMRSRRDLVYPWLFALFGLFIISCGMTHVLSVVVLWHPAYRLDGVVKAITALASFPTAILLFRVIPEAKLLPSPELLRRQNAALQAEIYERELAENEIRRLNLELERRVEERTTTLQRTNADLQNTNDLLDAVLDALPVGVVIAEPSGRIVRGNSALREIWGAVPYTSRWEQYGEWIAYSPKTGMRLAAHEWAMTRALLNGEIVKGDLLEIERFGTKEHRFILNNSAPVRDAQGRIILGVVAVMDITDRRQAEQSLRDSELRFRTLVEQASDAFFIHDYEGRFVDVNRQACASLGYSREELLRMNVGDVEVNFDLPGAMDSWRQIQTEEAYTSYGRHRRRDGTTFAVEARLSICEIRGQRLYLGLVRDITQREQMEQEVREHDATVRALLETASQAIIGVDPDGSIRIVNKMAELSFGYSREELLALQLEMLLPEKLRGRHAEYRAQYVAEPHLRRMGETLDLIARRRDGSEFPVEISLSYVETKNGILSVAFITDITDRRRAEDALRQSEGRFRQLADSMPQIVYTARPDGSVDYYNERWFDLAGTDDSFEGDQGWASILHPDDVQMVHDAWHSAVREGHVHHLQFRCWDRNENRWRWFMSRALPVRTDSGKIAKWFGTLTDIDDQKRVEDDLRRANQDLEQFAYSASHDLKEPLRNLAIYSEMLKKAYGHQVDEQGNEFLDHLKEGARRISILLSDLLAYTQVSTLGDDVVRPLDSGQVVDEVLQDLKGSITESEAIVTRSELPTVLVSAVHLRQLFQNLIANALKYRKDSELPRVHVTAASERDFCHFRVADNGIGIDPKYHTLIFGVFKRLHGRYGKYQGTGIGLAICQRIVERYGGRIWVDSELGAGATFHLLLPGVVEQNE